MDRVQTAGTTELVTDAGLGSGSGRVVEWWSYDPFGRVRSADRRQGATPAAVGRRNVGYTGHVEDEETGLVSMVGRTYSPALGRFLTPDPYVSGPVASQSHNRYSYVLTYQDPTGYAPRRSAPELPELTLDVIVVRAKRLRRPLIPTAMEAPSEAKPKPVAAREAPRGFDPPRGGRDVQDSGVLSRLYRSYSDLIGSMSTYAQEQAYAAGDFVEDVTGSAAASAYAATYVQATAGAAIGLLGIGLLPEQVMNSVGEFDRGLMLLADGVEQEDPYRAWMGVASVAGAVGTVAGAVATVAGGVAAAAKGKGSARGHRRRVCSRLRISGCESQRKCKGHSVCAGRR